ncbi:hypothetical protein [Bathymodiolus thermophilus thioautotrophic gill symbiont]|uniref:Uncharacterized protein n=1 Tax=Bathymodiolus thermophilus thioautotrophic gill symbiont TaxID=2360 RepID=A0A8H8XBV9_9GAMM|nr:hypothetical protein [Bathymodiolus thermophilus thioautotrophic gill symbiont]CAB5498948.1 hypothetical protein THERMOS_939 [Bathymodiolus thermophilus thioautotrophic gill symbiont]
MRSRLSRRKEEFERIDRVMEHPEDALVIHYSCESFYDRKDGKTPRVTSIAVRNLKSGQTNSFSIHKIAEQKTSVGTIYGHYNQLEKEMLKEYFEYLKENQGKTWIHWNMRDINYGFSALEHRFKALKGTPFLLIEVKKFDLSKAMVSLYGIEYIEHPRLTKLIKKNNDITSKDFLTGEEEADAFENKEYVKLHQSTLRKVDILANIFERIADRTIKTNFKWYKAYRWHPKVLVELIKQNSIISFLVLVGSLWWIVEAMPRIM